MLNILLAGVGGQGTVLASKILAKCAMNKDKYVKTAETIGMAQRGGCVVSHVRIGENIYSPIIPKGTADVIIAFEPAEAARTVSYLKPGGTIVVNANEVRPITDSLSDSGYSGKDMLEYLHSLPFRVIVIDCSSITDECKTTRVLNVALLGAAASAGVIETTPREIEAVIERELAPKYREINKKALFLAAQIL